MIRFNQDVYSHAEYLDILALAATDFLVNDELVAGYPWYGPHSRDTLVGLGALRHLKGGPTLARKMLKNYGRTLHSGRLPREVAGDPSARDYNPADAPLWFVIRCWEYGPKDRELLRRCSEVVLNYLFNNHLPFTIDHDGLIKTRNQAAALTWMDAAVGGRNVTPRAGKAVEVNALWYNALRCLEAMAQAQGLGPDDNLTNQRLKCRVAEVSELAEKVKTSLAVFGTGVYPADRIDDEGPVEELRPNAIIALSLPFDWLPVRAMERALELARRELLTAKGLRTLAPDSPGFKRKYVGNERQRNLAMHQGAVWPWLLAPLFRLAAKLKTGRQDWREFYQEASSLVWRFRSGFIRNHVATVPEIYDGLDPSFPKGCPASALAVLSLLEIEMMLQELGEGQ